VDVKFTVPQFPSTVGTIDFPVLEDGVGFIVEVDVGESMLAHGAISSHDLTQFLVYKIPVTSLLLLQPTTKGCKVFSELLGAPTTVEATHLVLSSCLGFNECSVFVFSVDKVKLLSLSTRFCSITILVIVTIPRSKAQKFVHVRSHLITLCV
jgi:hypothetical protein